MASHPPPPSPRKLRNVIEAGMMNIENIPKETDDDFDPRAWELSYHIPTDLPDILKTVENNFKNPEWERLNPAILNGDGWYLWQPNEGQDSDYLVWLSAGQVKSDEWGDMSLMTMVTDDDPSRKKPHGDRKYTIDNLVVTRVHQNDTWGHQKDFLYTLILPTDKNKMWIPMQKIDNVAINWKRFPKVLVEWSKC